jgi:GNAT superfamily N-acetyltransferase
VRELETFGAWSDEPEPVALLATKLHNPRAAELYVMGVMSRHQGRGIGTRLVETAERALRDRGVKFLQVKTLGPSDADEHYARTRRFYESRGFVPLEELLTLWPDNPCLVMVKQIGAAAAS